MSGLIDNIKERFAPLKPIEPGAYQYRTPQDAENPYRLHLRIEADGGGVLIVNAATVLHLNQTAAEFIYHMMQGRSNEEVSKRIAARYRITRDKALVDYLEIKEKVETLIHVPDLDPVTFLNIEREEPYSGRISAPYRLDIALTYQQPDGQQPEYAPTKRVDRELATDEWKSIIKKAWYAGIPHIVFTGGEPTLRKDLPELIRYCEELGQVTGLLTNGYRLLDDAYRNIILQTGLDHLMFLLEPASDESWNALAKVLPEDLHTTVHLTVQQNNANNIGEILTNLAAMDANALSLSTESHEHDDVIKYGQERAAELELPLVWDLPVPYSSHNPVNLELEEHNTIEEGAGKAWLYVEPDGDVLPTQGVNQVLGNMLSEEWEKIWEKS